jgi:hypothetical protein
LLLTECLSGFCDKQHRALKFALGDWAWLRLNHRAAVSAGCRRSIQAGPQIHNVFHVEFLRRFEGTAPTEVPRLLPPIVRGRVVPQPAQVLRVRPTKASWELLVRWADRSAAQATYMGSVLIPSFSLLFQQVRGNVMDQYFGQQHGRRPRKEAAAKKWAQGQVG